MDGVIGVLFQRYQNLLQCFFVLRNVTVVVGGADDDRLAPNMQARLAGVQDLYCDMP